MPYREQLPYTDPLKAGRHPFQTYLLVLCLVSGAPLATGRTTPGSIADTLPELLVIAWGAMLVLGSATALIGTFWRRNYATALTLERAGLWSTGGAALAYGLCIFASNPFVGLVASFIILAFGAACIKRARDIGYIFKRALDDHPAVVETEEGR